MARPRTVHLMGDLDGFGIALAVRLSSRNRLFTVSKATLSRLEDKIETMGLHDGNNQYLGSREVYPNDLIVITSELEQQFDMNIAEELPADVQVINLSSENLGASQPDFIATNIVIKDMIPESKSSFFQSESLASAYRQKERSENTDCVPSYHWWVAQQDVIDALVCLFSLDCKLPRELNICGRKMWSLADTKDQLKMLYDRTVAGQTGSFEISHLAANSPIPNGLVAIEEVSNNVQRPSLASLHGLLLETSCNGWRPQVTLRTALMKYIALQLND